MCTYIHTFDCVSAYFFFFVNKFFINLSCLSICFIASTIEILIDSCFFIILWRNGGGHFSLGRGTIEASLLGNIFFLLARWDVLFCYFSCLPSLGSRLICWSCLLLVSSFVVGESYGWTLSILNVIVAISKMSFILWPSDDEIRSIKVYIWFMVVESALSFVS